MTGRDCGWCQITGGIPRCPRKGWTPRLCEAYTGVFVSCRRLAMLRSIAVASLLLSTAAPALAQVPPGNSAPQPVPFVDTIPAPQDTPYPGTILLNVDATNTEQGIFRVKETIPVAKAGRWRCCSPSGCPARIARAVRSRSSPASSSRRTAASFRGRATWSTSSPSTSTCRRRAQSGRRVPVYLGDQARSGPHRRDAQHDQPRTQFGQPVSRGLFHPSDPDPDDGEVPDRLDRGGAVPAKANGRPTSTTRRITRSWSIRRCSPAATARRGRCRSA